jgi:hypothetical protein
MRFAPEFDPADQGGEGRDDDRSIDEDFPLGDGTADLEATASCPYCGEPVTLALDPGSGEDQEYVEDCPVCCQPWVVSVRYGSDGRATIQVDQQ